MKCRVHPPQDVQLNYRDLKQSTELLVDTFELHGVEMLKFIASDERYSESERVDMIFWLRTKEWKIPTKEQVTCDDTTGIITFDYTRPREPAPGDHLVISAIHRSYE